MDDIKKLIDDLRHMQGLGWYGANGQAAAALERLYAENADLRARLEQAYRELASVDRALDFAGSARISWNNGEEILRSRSDRIDGMGQAGAYWRSTIDHPRGEIRSARNDARADLERAQAEAAAMREALEWYFKEDEKSVQDGILEDVSKRPAHKGLSTTAGADLLAEVARLREVERLAREYRKVVRDTTAHEEAKPSWFPNEDLEGNYYGKENELWHREEEAKKVFFAVLGKEND